MKEVKEIIEQLVKQEIRDILAENEDTIRGIVKASLLSELRAAIRDSAYKALNDLAGEPPETEDNQQVAKPDAIESDGRVQESKRDPSPDFGLRTSDFGLTTPDPGHHTSDLVPWTSDLGHRTSDPGHRTSDPGHWTSDVGPTEGRYLYCVVEGSEEVSLGRIGIEENEVYTIPYEDICGVVHNCSAEPYQSEDEETMKNWVMAHQNVIDWASEKFGAVLPLGFDTIIQGDETTSPKENMENWLKDDYDNLKEKMGKIGGRAEYGVQVFWDPKIIAKKITEESPEIKKLDEEIRSKPKGLAYMYKQKLEDLIKKEMEGKADQDFKEFFERIQSCADELKVEKTKKAEDERQMLMNLSCLLPKEASKKLGEELEKIDGLEGFSVRYTGPWPPYSFV